MRVAFRVDASMWMGQGHVMRCAALAWALQLAGASVQFFCREMPNTLRDWLLAKGIPVQRLQSASDLEALPEWQEALFAFAPDWLVVDHYELDARFERASSLPQMKMLVLDDLANRPHVCDLLLDQNWHEDAEQRYAMLLPVHCRQLLGPRYALLRQEFADARQNLQRQTGNIRTLMISFGGSDPGNETSKVLRVLQRFLAVRKEASVQTEVIVGGLNPNPLVVEALAAEIPGCRCEVHVDDMAMRMSQADLLIGAGGTTTWERCCLGLPSILIATADNQEALSEAVHQQGAALYLGRSENVTEEILLKALSDLWDNPGLRASMSQNAMTLVDGLGCQRVVEAMYEFTRERAPGYSDYQVVTT
ncbi:MAG TPA: UDP-2,4-diacetamido-2,4,6-trideoxy-beta-L-altropyranose hydrolase [Oculatellaceae cyanobacterium]|jgi:UDP-2,4-diacetamido-2,4,6-trideoxy-beta-L-altropyranose hydrolase